MSVKRNVVRVRIAYSNELINRTSVTDEFNFALELNKLLDQHKHLGIHSDSVPPTVTHQRQHDAQAEYGCNINLQFHIRHKDGKLYEYARLHFLLQEIAKLCGKYESKFIRMEWYLDLSGMARPWALVAAPQTVLLRKGAAQYNAVGQMVPGFFNHMPIDGLTVMGEPRAVRDFQRAWEFKARQYHALEHGAGYIAGMEQAGIHHGPQLNMELMREQFPKIQWQHLLVWAHAKHVPGNEGWFVVNLDRDDQWVLMAAQYVNGHAVSMMQDPMPYTEMFTTQPNDLRFLSGMEAVAFDTQGQESIRDAEVVEVIDDGVPV